MDWNVVKDQLAEDLKNDPRFQPGQGYDTFFDAVMGFFHAIDWYKDRWLRVLLGFHLLAYLITFKTRKSTTLQAMLLLLWSACVYASQTLNDIGKATWRSFSTQNYFDSNGAFIGILYATPLLILLFCQLLNALVRSAYLLIDVKRAELQADAKKKKKQ